MMRPPPPQQSIAERKSTCCGMAKAARQNSVQRVVCPCCGCCGCCSGVCCVGDDGGGGCWIRYLCGCECGLMGVWVADSQRQPKQPAGGRMSPVPVKDGLVALGAEVEEEGVGRVPHEERAQGRELWRGFGGKCGV